MFNYHTTWKDNLKTLMEYESHCSEQDNHAFGFALSGIGTYGWCLYDKKTQSFLGKEDGKSIVVFIKKEDAEEVQKTSTIHYDVLRFLLAEIEQ